MKINDAYVKAIYDLSLQDKKIEQVLSLSKTLTEQISLQPKIVNFLADHLISVDAKKQFLKKITSYQHFVNWILILIKDQQIINLSIYLKKIISVYNENHKITEGIIWTTTNLSKLKINQLVKIYETKLNKTVFLENKIDQEILGGIKVVLDNTIWDRSVKGQINSLAESLIKKEITK